MPTQTTPTTNGQFTAQHQNPFQGTAPTNLGTTPGFTGTSVQGMNLQNPYGVQAPFFGWNAQPWGGLPLNPWNVTPWQGSGYGLVPSGFNLGVPTIPFAGFNPAWSTMANLSSVGYHPFSTTQNVGFGTIPTFGSPWMNPWNTTYAPAFNAGMYANGLYSTGLYNTGSSPFNAVAQGVNNPFGVWNSMVASQCAALGGDCPCPPGVCFNPVTGTYMPVYGQYSGGQLPGNFQNSTVGGVWPWNILNNGQFAGQFGGQFNNPLTSISPFNSINTTANYPFNAANTPVNTFQGSIPTTTPSFFAPLGTNFNFAQNSTLGLPFGASFGLPYGSGFGGASWNNTYAPYGVVQNPALGIVSNPLAFNGWNVNSGVSPVINPTSPIFSGTTNSPVALQNNPFFQGIQAAFNPSQTIWGQNSYQPWGTNGLTGTPWNNTIGASYNVGTPSTVPGFARWNTPFNAFPTFNPGTIYNGLTNGFFGVPTLVNPTTLSHIAGTVGTIPASPFAAGMPVTNPLQATIAAHNAQIQNGIQNGQTIASGPSLVGCCREAA